MSAQIRPAIYGTFAAIAITTAMDATGYTAFSALSLFPLAAIFWWLQKFSRQDIGLIMGDARSWGWAIATPLIVLGAIIATAFVAGVIDTSNAKWNNVGLNIAVGSTIGIVVVTMTEEGFFRGWLWASLKRAELNDKQVLGWTTFAFVIWHVSAITLDTGFDLPVAEMPIYYVNAALIGATWGLLRHMSGSVVVASVCHAIWNAIAYSLFGFGEKVGALGIQQTHIFGPEVGVIGIVFNAIAFLLLWRRVFGEAGVDQKPVI